MQQKLREYIAEHQLINSNDRLLIALSGGIDSMVLLQLFETLPYYIEVAHMNFGLRGEESNGDQHFVEEYCAAKGIFLHVKKVDTLAYMAEHKLSVQMAARNLRYEWFEELKKERQLKYVLTAHHADDSIETVFINIIRGTGLKGLKGIVSNENTIRPLLCFNRNDILTFAKRNNIKWREDSSNAKEDYLRNKLRHTILPLLDSISNHWRDNMLQLNEDVEVSDRILTKYYEEHISDIYKNGNIDLRRMAEIENSTWLFQRLLLSFNFTYQTSSDILKNLDIQTGKEFESATHRLIKERNFFEVVDKMERLPFDDSLFILEEDRIVKVGELMFDIQIHKPESFTYKYELGEVYLDYNKLSFPLLVRKWQKGDWFVPYGMKGKKKLSDFFVDEKFTIQEKENTFVIVSGEDIVCILGHRTDDRYRIKEGISIIYHIKQKHG